MLKPIPRALQCSTRIRHRWIFQRHAYTDSRPSRRKEKLSGFKAFKKAIISVLDEEVDRRKHTWKPLEDTLELKHDPREAGSFEKFGVSPLVVKSVQQSFPVKEPTEIQRKLLAVLSSGYSTVVRGAQGSGKSFATLMYALSKPRATTHTSKPATTTLILVKNTSLAVQYKHILESILKPFDGDPAKVAQFFYRCNEEEEAHQLQQWRSLDPPHIIVSTPQRLLDLIQEFKNPRELGLSDLKAVICDDAEFLLLDGAPKKKKKPAESLISYLLELRRTDRDDSLGNVIQKPDVQFGFLVDTVSAELIHLLEKQKWFNWEKAKMVGVSPITTEREGKDPLIPQSVKVGAVVVNEEGSLKDVTPFETDKDLELHSEVGYVMDINYKKHRVYLLRNQNKNLLRPTKYVSRIVEKLSGQTLLLHHETESSLKIQKEIQAEGYFAKVFNTTEDFSDFFNREFEDFSEENPHFLITNVQNVLGLTFKNLQNIVCLGVDTLIDPRTMAMLGGRFRSDSGLVDEEHNANLVFLFTDRDFGYIERKHLERTMMKVGNVPMKPFTGQPETFDMKDYKKFFENVEQDEAVYEVY